MLAYTCDPTLDGVLSAVFDAFALRQQPEVLMTRGGQLPLFCDGVHAVETTGEKARRVWTGLERRLSKEALSVITISYQSEEPGLDTPLFNYLCKVFRQPAGAPSIEHNFADPDVLHVRNTCRRVLHEQLRMKQFIRFQKAKDGTYLSVVAPDHDVLPLITAHFQDRFGTQPWLIYDARRHYGYYYTPAAEGVPEPVRITFEDEAAVPFDLGSGRLDNDTLSSDDRLLQHLWRTYFKAICIRERLNPRKQAGDMPRRYWKYITEKNG